MRWQLAPSRSLGAAIWFEQAACLHVWHNDRPCGQHPRVALPQMGCAEGATRRTMFIVWRAAPLGVKKGMVCKSHDLRVPAGSSGV